MTRLKRLLPILLAITVAAICFACVPSGGGSRDTVAPSISLTEQPTFYAEERAVIRLASATDDTDGEVSVTFSLYAPSGKEVGTSGGAFTPHEIGEYRIVFFASDKAGNTAKKEQTFTVLSLFDKPEIILGEYESTAKEGEPYTLPECSATERDTKLEVSVAVKNPHGESVEVADGKFFVDCTGVYDVEFFAELSGGSKIERSIKVTALYGEKTVAGIDGDITGAPYDGVKSTVLGGLRGLESIYVKTVRTESGIIMAFDGREDKRVSGNERIEVFFAADGNAMSPADGSKRLYLYTTGRIEYYEWEKGGYGRISALDYRDRAVYAVKLAAGTTLDGGNDTDKGYTSELFVPYGYLGAAADENIYMTLGCVREADDSRWDGWNEFPIYPDPSKPYKYVELRPDGYLFNDDRLYRDAAKADGKVDDGKYDDILAARAQIAGARNLEGVSIRIARDGSGLYFAFSVAADKKVNDFDRVELYLNAGERTRHPNTACLQFRLQSNGALSVLRGNGSYYVDFDASGSSAPAAASTYGKNTTPNYNADQDDGYFAELFVPYAMFEEYCSYSVDKETRFGVTFGIWRVSENSHTTLEWGNDPAKDWDGYTHGEFCDPLYPDTYAVLFPDGRILAQNEIVEIIGDPTDPSVDGVLDESYWKDAATLDIAPTGELDGIETKVYRAEDGLRVAFIGEVRRFTSKDAIAFYVSTRDSSYTLGGKEDNNDSYEVFGRYASPYDMCFQIWFDSSVAVYRGKYKDWAERIYDLSDLSLYIAKTDHGMTVEMLIPYSFLATADFTPSKIDTLGVTVRLAGENSRGSVVWNNLHYAGIYADSESPASYVRIDKDNKLFAATKNDCEARIDGEFTDAVYSAGYAEIEIGGANVKLYRGTDGLYGRVNFGIKNSVSLVVSTLDHGLKKPYVYDYLITVTRDGKAESAYGNSHGFYDPTLYVSYCTPRAVINGAEAELFIPYEYLSRYNANDTYTQKGYMSITESSALKVAAAADGTTAGSATYNGNGAEFDLLDPTTYVDLATKEN